MDIILTSNYHAGPPGSPVHHHPATLYPFYHLDHEVFDRIEFMHPAVGRMFQAWLDLDCGLICLQESLPICLKLMYKAPGRREAGFVSRLLPEATMRVGVEFSMDV